MSGTPNQRLGAPQSGICPTEATVRPLDGHFVVRSPAIAAEARSNPANSAGASPFDLPGRRDQNVTAWSDTRSRSLMALVPTVRTVVGLKWLHRGPGLVPSYCHDAEAHLWLARRKRAVLVASLLVRLGLVELSVT